MPKKILVLIGLVFALLVPAAAFADDWVAIKLRGQVLQYVDGDWSNLQRGDIVPDDRVIRTLGSGRVDFRRDEETITLGAHTQIQIKDKAGQRYTTVKQYFGSVEVQAEVRDVQHFAVETPFLAAVVKGTRFVVTSGKTDASVRVKRGKVEVTALKTGSRALIPAGQTVTVADDGDFTIKGRGASKTQVFGADGELIGIGGISVGVDGVQVSTGKVAGVGVTASVGGNGVSAGVDTPVAGANVNAGGGGGVSVDANVGGTNVGVSVGGGNGVSVNVGGIGINIGGGGGLL